MYGFASGLGVALADATYGAIAAFGLTALTSVLVAGHTLLGLVGGAIIIVLGIRTATARPPTAAADIERPGLVGAFASIYALTMTNPLTIILYAGVFASMGLTNNASFLDAAAVTLGVWLGSTAWWVILCSFLAWVRGRVSTRAMLWVNRVSGAALVVFGLFAVVAVIRG